MPGDLLLLIPACMPSSVLCSLTFECPGNGTHTLSLVVSRFSHRPCYYTAGDNTSVVSCGGHAYTVKLIFDAAHCRWRCSLVQIAGGTAVYSSGYLSGKDPRGTYPDGVEVHSVTVT